MLRSKAPKLYRGLLPLTSSPPAASFTSSSLLAGGHDLDPAQTPKQQKVGSSKFKLTSIKGLVFLHPTWSGGIAAVSHVHYYTSFSLHLHFFPPFV